MRFRDAQVEVDSILAVPAQRYSEFSSDVPQWHTELEASSAKSGEHLVTQSTFQSRSLIISHDPVHAAEQRRARRERIEALCQFGNQLAERLDRQDQGKPGRGRRATDRHPYARFQKAVGDTKLTRSVKPDLMAERCGRGRNNHDIEAAERLDGKLFLVTSLSELRSEQVVERYKALADIERGFRALKKRHRNCTGLSSLARARTAHVATNPTSSRPYQRPTLRRAQPSHRAAARFVRAA